MVVGAVNDRGVGSVFIYNHLNGSWDLETKLTPTIPNLRNFGRTVVIKGNIIVVGDCVYGDPRKGAYLYIYMMQLRVRGNCMQILQITIAISGLALLYQY